MVEKKKYEKTLIQTQEASIVYGEFKGEKNQELFRCPRKLEDTDLRRYVNENNCLLGFESDDKQETALNEIPGYLGYYRLYFRDGWYGKWMEKLIKSFVPGLMKLSVFCKIIFHMAVMTGIWRHGCRMNIQPGDAINVSFLSRYFVIITELCLIQHMAMGITQRAFMCIIRIRCKRRKNYGNQI